MPSTTVHSVVGFYAVTVTVETVREMFMPELSGQPIVWVTTKTEPHKCGLGGGGPPRNQMKRSKMKKNFNIFR